MRRYLLFLVALAVFLSACSDEQAAEPEAKLQSAEFENVLLGYVPADTPYYFVGGEDTPQEVIDKMKTLYADLWTSIAEEAISDYKEMRDETGAEATDEEALAEEIIARVDADGLAAFGIDYTDDVVFYGFGVLPVLRVNMSYPDKFRSLVALIESHMDESLPVATHEGNSFWRVENDDIVFLFGLKESMFVATVTPLESEAETLAHVFGPANTANALPLESVLALADKYDFTYHAVGRVDIVDLARRLMAMDTSDPLYGMLNEDMDLDPACREEILGFLANAPAAVMGYSELSASKYAGSFIIELEPTLAQDLSGLAVPLPGMGQPTDAPAAFGVAFDLAGASRMARDWLQDAAQRDFACEELAQVDYAGNAQQVNPAALGMMGNPKGFFFRLDSREIDWIDDEDFSKASFTVSGMFENPSTIKFMAQTFIPPLQQMDIQPNGEIFKLDVEELAAATGESVPAEMQGKLPEVWGVMTENLLAVASGPGAELRLQATITAEAQDDPPVIWYQIDMPWVMELSRKQLNGELEELRAQLPVTDFNEGIYASAEDYQASIEAQIKALEKQIEFSDVYGDLMGKTIFAVRFTGDGIRMDSVSTLP